MILIPMAFMLVVTISSLILNTKGQFAKVADASADWGTWVQIIVGILLIVLAVVLAIEGIMTIAKASKKKQAA